MQVEVFIEWVCKFENLSRVVTRTGDESVVGNVNVVYIPTMCINNFIILGSSVL